MADDKAPPDTNTQEWRDYQSAVGAAKPGTPGYKPPPKPQMALGAGVKAFRPQGKTESIQDYIAAKKAFMAGGQASPSPTTDKSMTTAK